MDRGAAGDAALSVTLIRVVAAAALVVLTACPAPDDRSRPSPATPSGPPPAGTIRFAYPAEPPTLDPASSIGGGAATRDLLRGVLPALFGLDERLRPVPELAASWPGPADVSFDPFSVRVRLREATWSDGTPITSEDVRFSWERLRDGPTGARYRFLRDVEIASQRELVLRFDRTVRRWWTVFGVDDMVLPAHAYNPEWAGGPTVAGGPFVFDGWTPGLSVRLRRNDRWFGGQAQAEAVEILFVADDETRLQLLERGEVDVVYGPGEANWGHRARIRGFDETDREIEAGGASGVWGPTWWELDADLDRLGDRRVLAEALMTAVDRDLAAEILEDSGRTMDAIPHRFDERTPRGPWNGGDVERAREMLSRAGYSERDGALVRGGGSPEELLLAFPEESGAAGAIARMIHFQVRPLGIRVEIVPLSAERLEREWIPERRADLYLVLRRGADAPDSFAYRSDAPGPGRTQDLDDTLDAAATAVAQRRLDGRVVTGLAEGAWADVQRRLAETAAVAPMARVRTWIVARESVSGPRATGTSAGPLWNVQEWRIAS